MRKALPSRRRWVPMSMLIAAASATAAGAAGPDLSSHSTGPDVTVRNFSGYTNYTPSGPEAGYRAYSFGTIACNVGDQPLWWCGATNGHCTEEQHPVIAQNLYRLRDAIPGRFEQIGASWVAHRFGSTNTTNVTCNPGHPPCAVPPHGSDQLGVSCSDTSSTTLNGTRSLGMRSEVDATSGSFPYPYTAVGFSAAVDQRMIVLESDLAPVSNPDSMYFAEAQYVTADDAAANNGLNNASWALVGIAAGISRDITGGTVQFPNRSALYAWKLHQSGTDPVEIADVDFTTSPSTIVERFEVGRQVVDLGNGQWHYEFAVRNMNSDRAARAFTATFLPTTTVSNAGFHVINHHSGEPYATDGWSFDDSAGNAVTWFTHTFATNPNANALRWGTMFTFWVDADQAPGDSSFAITLFKPGSPSMVFAGFGTLLSDGFESGSFSAWSGETP